jgi:hypothetical protein
MLVHSVQAIVDLMIDPILASFGVPARAAVVSTPIHQQQRDNENAEHHGDNFLSVANNNMRNVNATQWMFLVTAWVVGIVAIIVLSEYTQSSYVGYSFF